MMDYDDFEELNRLLEKCCDSCLLTRAHCAGCRIDKLLCIVGQLSKSSSYELISLEDLKILLKLAGVSNEALESDLTVVEKWRHIESGRDRNSQ
jgi:hypothetical protein